MSNDYVACKCCGNKSELECKHCGTPFCCGECYDCSKEWHQDVCAEIHDSDLVAAFLAGRDVQDAVQLLPNQFEGTRKVVMDQITALGIPVHGIQKENIGSGRSITGYYRRFLRAGMRKYDILPVHYNQTFGTQEVPKVALFLIGDQHKKLRTPDVNYGDAIREVQKAYEAGKIKLEYDRLKVSVEKGRITPYNISTVIAWPLSSVSIPPPSIPSRPTGTVTTPTPTRKKEIQDLISHIETAPQTPRSTKMIEDLKNELANT